MTPFFQYSIIPFFLLSPSSSPAKDTGLSRRQQGFESPWGRQAFSKILLILNCGVLGAKDIPVFTYRGNRGSNPLGDAKLILRKPHILLGLFLLLRLGHPPALPGDNRG